MKIIALFTNFSLFMLLIGCGGSNPAASSLFEIKIENNKKQFVKSEEIGVLLVNKKNTTIEKVSYSIDGIPLTLTNNKLILNVPTLGNKELKATITYEGRTADISKKIKLLAHKGPELYRFEIVNEYPHDNTSYTQGLEFYKDTLYESTGRKGFSYIRKLDFKTGKVIKQVDLDATYFGEGITILNNKLYQLTWQGKTGFIYDLPNLTKIGSFNYGSSKEGWGLCNDGNKIFKSDGTEKIWFLNPTTLIEEGNLQTVTNKSVFNRANELEYVNGKIYANVYGKPNIMIIDATSGAIEGVVSLGSLLKKISKGANWDAGNSVLNGIAYNPSRKTFFVTGKNWNKIFELNIFK